MIGLNQYNVYALLRYALMYDGIYICPYLGYLIGDFLRLIIFVRFFVAHQ